MTQGPARFGAFVGDVAELVSATNDEALIVAAGTRLLADLVAHDDWLADAFARPEARRYAQHLLHLDGCERFSVVSFVWGPGQSTPVHDHTVWGLIGMLRGAELSQAYLRDQARLVPDGPVRRLVPGDVEVVSPAIGDVHQVSNALLDRTSISIHLYGGNIGSLRRHSFDVLGRSREFISGYSNDHVPNFGETAKEATR